MRGSVYVSFVVNMIDDCRRDARLSRTITVISLKKGRKEISDSDRTPPQKKKKKRKKVIDELGSRSSDF